MKIEHDTDIDPDAHVTVYARFGYNGAELAIAENVPSATAKLILVGVVTDYAPKILGAPLGAWLNITPETVELVTPTGDTAMWWIA